MCAMYHDILEGLVRYVVLATCHDYMFGHNACNHNRRPTHAQYRHAKVLEQGWGRWGGGRRGEAVQALGCCLKRLLSRLLKTQRPGLSVYLFHVNIQREPTVNSSIFLKTFCLAGSKLYLHEARHFEFGH